MKFAAASLASIAFAGLAAAAPAKRQCSAPTTSSAPVPTSTDPVPTTSAPPTSVPPTSQPPAPTSSSTPPVSGSGEGSSGALFSVYADTGIDGTSFPAPADLGDWNDLILAFELSAGAWDAANVWQAMDNSTKKSTSDAYHAAGKKIRVAIFGATEYPLLSGEDPVELGNKFAQFVIDNQLDGIDVDYEDSGSFQTATGGGEDFLISLTKTLRAKLPSPQYFITHAPQAPYFTTGTNYPNGAYLKVHKEVGDLIDAYEIQFYNQGAGAYEDCDGLYTTAPKDWPGTTVAGIIASGIPASKVIIGKPGQAGDANNGLMTPADIGACVTKNNGNSGAGGIMAWQWSHAPASWIAAAKGSLA